MTFCPECGLQQSQGNRFCVRCGTELAPEAQPTDVTGPIPLEAIREDVPAAALRAGDVPSLAVRSGEPAGTVFLLHGGLITIGRSPESDIFLDDITVSREHAQLHRAGPHYELRDLGSLNGTYVNRDRIELGALLRDGDEVQIGKFRLVYFG
jgi:hypothetical protein